MRLIVTFTILLLTGCGGSKTSSANKASSADQKLADDSLLTGGLALAAKSKATQKKINELRGESELMCKRTEAQRAACPAAATTLRAADDAALLGCALPNANALADFEVDIVSPAGGKIFFTTNSNLWQSTSVGSGQKQKLTWGPRKSDPCATIKMPVRNIEKLTVRSPRVIELPDLFLNFDPDSCATKKILKIADIPDFKFYVGGREIFNRSDLIESAAGLRLSMNKLLDASLNTQCIVPADELEKELRKVRESLLAAEPVVSDKVSQKALDGEFAKEVNRNEQLKAQLLGKENLGCWGYSKIRRLQVVIDGVTAPDLDLGLSAAQLTNSGNSRAFDFYFGQNLVYSIADETTSGLFKKAGGFVSTDFTDREIQELRSLRIVKGGMAYLNEHVSKPGFLGFGNWSGYQRYETDRRVLTNLSIFANDQLIYKKNGINFTFEGKNLVWPPQGAVESIQSSEEFVNLMRRNDCPADI